MAADTEEPELITEDATRLAVPSFGAKKPLVDAEPEKSADGGAAAAAEAADAVPEDISAFYSKIGQHGTYSYYLVLRSSKKHNPCMVASVCGFTGEHLSSYGDAGLLLVFTAPGALILAASVSVSRLKTATIPVLWIRNDLFWIQL